MDEQDFRDMTVRMANAASVGTLPRDGDTQHRGSRLQNVMAAPQ